MRFDLTFSDGRLRSILVGPRLIEDASLDRERHLVDRAGDRLALREIGRLNETGLLDRESVSTNLQHVIECDGDEIQNVLGAPAVLPMRSAGIRRLRIDRDRHADIANAAHARILVLRGGERESVSTVLVVLDDDALARTGRRLRRFRSVEDRKRALLRNELRGDLFSDLVNHRTISALQTSTAIRASVSE